MSETVTYLLEVTVTLDKDEVGPNTEKLIRSAIESLDPSIGIFIVEDFQTE